MKTITIAILIVLLVAGIGCSKKHTAEPTPPPSDEAVLASGWEALRLSDYAAAEGHFRTLLDRGALLPAAYDGLGWTFTLTGDPDQAVTNFRQSVTEGVDTTPTKDQARAGLCFAENAQGNHQACLDSGALVAANWVFIQNSALDHDAVVLTMAVSHYALGDFTACLAAVRQVDPTFPANTDVSTVDGRARLAARIEELRAL